MDMKDGWGCGRTHYIIYERKGKDKKSPRIARISGKGARKSGESNKIFSRRLRGLSQTAHTALAFF